MNTSQLTSLIRRFLEAEPKDPAIQRHHEEHLRRQEAAARLLHPDRIPSLTRAEITAFLKDTDAYYGVRGRQQLCVASSASRTSACLHCAMPCPNSSGAARLALPPPTGTPWIAPCLA